MKPLVLTMEAFGSYGQKTTIDFNDLNQNLFLITGDTGAGKSTIFDAIVFAIYGEASSNSNKKDGRELQSQYTNYETEPYVELTFSELTADGAQIYTVRRVPRHFMQMKRKEGVKEVSEKVTLTMPDGSDYPEKEANKKIEEIVGLTKNQFMQIAMIAQGEFMELLRAKSDEKKVIFRKLFNTELYQEIVNEFSNRKKSIEKEISVIRTVCQTETAHIVIPEQYERKEELQSLKTKIMASERLSVVDMEQLINELKLLTDSLSKQYAVADEQYRAAELKKDLENSTYAKAETLNKFFKQLDDANTALQECNAQEAEMQEKARLAKKILEAYDIQPKHVQYQEKVQDVKNIEYSLKEQVEKTPSLEVNMAKTAKEESIAQLAYENELNSFTIVENKVNAARRLFSDIKTAEVEIAQKEEAHAILEAKIQQQEESLKKLEADILEWKIQEEKLNGTDHAIELLVNKKNECNSIYKEVQVLGEKEKNLNKQTDKIIAETSNYQLIESQYVEMNSAYESYRKDFFNAQAGIIAREELKEGMPCPVCGSLVHPNPCKLNHENRNLTRDGLEQLAQKVDALRKTQEDKSAELQSLRASVSEQTKSLGESLNVLANRLQLYIETVPNQITVAQAMEHVKQWVVILKNDDTKLQQDQAILQQLRKDLADSDAKLQDFRVAIEQSKDEKNNIFIALQTRKNELAGYKEQLEYATEAEAQFAYDTAKIKKADAEKVFNQAKQSASDAKTAYENANTLIEKYRIDLPNAKKALNEKEEVYKAALVEYAMDEQTWTTLVMSYTKRIAVELQDEIDIFKQKKLQAESVKASADQGIDGQARPALDILEQSKKDAEAQYYANQNIFNTIKENYRINVGVYEALSPKMDERKELVERHTKIDMLYRMLSGNVSGSRMDIETYAQRYYMDKILYAANSRFQEMSAGQFELRMYDLEKAGEGKNRGLDLIVYSNVTGKEREVRTLSGGESFMAALALALGMADQIQEKSAAINLDIMFIDEGFGSLDDYSREQAVKVLREMANGSKLIGIISHVTELKQQIDNQLVVKKDEQGSHVRWQIS